MDEKDPESQEQGVTQQRRPYVPPRIEESGRYETLVLGCAMAMGDSPQCNASPNSMMI